MLTGENFVIVENKNRSFTIVCQEVERFYMMPLETIISKTRKRLVVEKRQMLQILAVEHTELNKSEIGMLTNKDHCAVIHAQKTMKDLMSIDKRLAEDYSIISKKIKRRITKLNEKNIK